MLIFLLLAVLQSSSLFAQPRDLTAGTPVERELFGLEPHVYRVAANAGELVTVDVEQRGVDVIVTVVDPQGRRVVDFDSPNGPQGPEPVRFVAAAAGRYEIRLRSFEPDAPAGRYQVVLRSVAPATANQRAEADGMIKARSVSPLQARISGLTTAIDARWGVYAKCLETGEEVAIEADRPLETMSVIKLSILAELFNQVNAGTLSLDERITVTVDDVQAGTGIIRLLDAGAGLTLRDLATLMIVVSDNTATELILRRLGGRSGVNALMQRYGLGTRLEVDSAHEWFAAAARAESVVKFHEDDMVHFGLSSARDMGKLLEMMMRGQVVSQAASAQMIQMMRSQLYASRLPRDLPLSYRLPHKTGDLPPLIQNDVGIVEAGGKHIVVVVFASHHRGDGLLLDQTIGRIGQLIQDYYARP